MIVEKSRRIPWTGLLVGAVFLGPLLAAWILYSSGWRPAGYTFHGQLIDPPVVLDSAPLPLLSGSDSAAGLLRGEWSLIVVTDDGCGAQCRDVLYLTRQLRLGFGREMPRIERMLLVTGGVPDQAFLTGEHADLTALTTAGGTGQALAAAIRSAVAGESIDGRVFLSDPLGNLMMSYPRGADWKGMREDLKRLLKLSRIG